MKIYLDIVLLENFIMNYIIIFSTAIISKSTIHYWKIGLASIVAGIYSILNYMCNFGNTESVIIKFLISIMIILIAFDSRKFKTILKQLILFYLVSFTFGGISFMLLFLINPENVVFENGVLSRNISCKSYINSGSNWLFNYIYCVIYYTRQNTNKIYVV